MTSTEFRLMRRILELRVELDNKDLEQGPLGHIPQAQVWSELRKVGMTATASEEARLITIVKETQGI